MTLRLITKDQINALKPYQGNATVTACKNEQEEIVGYKINATEANKSKVKKGDEKESASVKLEEPEIPDIGLFTIVADSYDSDGGNHGKYIKIWTPHNNKEHFIYFSLVELNSDNKFFHTLLDKGFQLNVEPAIIKVIKKLFINEAPQYHMPYITGMGYMQSLHGYAFPDGSYTKDGQFEVILDQSKDLPPVDIIGDYAQWKTEIAGQAVKGKIPSFVMMYSIASMLLPFSDLGTLFLHLWGQSSCGKSLMLQLAGSVYGSGIDPRVGAGSMIQKWNTTSIAVLDTAQKFNGSILLLDEIGECEDTEFQKVIYQINGGVGKSRATSGGRVKKTESWSLLGVSSGEISGRAKIENSGGEQKEGEAVRFLDIHIQEQIFPGINDVSTFVESLKHACGQHGGHASRDFIKKLLGIADSEETLSETVLVRVEIALTRLSKNKTFSSVS